MKQHVIRTVGEIERDYLRRKATTTWRLTRHALSKLVSRLDQLRGTCSPLPDRMFSFHKRSASCTFSWILTACQKKKFRALFVEKLAWIDDQMV